MNILQFFGATIFNGSDMNTFKQPALYLFSSVSPPGPGVVLPRGDGGAARCGERASNGAASCDANSGEERQTVTERQSGEASFVSVTSGVPLGL